MYYYYSRQDCRPRAFSGAVSCSGGEGGGVVGATDRFNLNGMRAFQDVRRRSTGKFRTRREQEKKYEPTPLSSIYSRRDVPSAAPAANSSLPWLRSGYIIYLFFHLPNPIVRIFTTTLQYYRLTRYIILLFFLAPLARRKLREMILLY